MTARVGHLIDGTTINDSNGEYFPSFDPVTGQPWVEVRRGTPADVDAAVTAADKAFRSWKKVGPSRRAELLWRLGDVIVDHCDEIAMTEARDVGKVIREMRGQIRACAVGTGTTRALRNTSRAG